MLSRRRARGFTLIEVLVGITLVAIVIALGMPSLSQFIQNNKIGSVAANYYAGLQLARSEAIRSNIPVEFVMTDQTGLGATPGTAGHNWVVRAIPPSNPASAYLIDQKIGLEGEGTSAQAVQINIAAAPTGFDGRIIFDAFGAPADKSNPYSINITNPALGGCAPTGPARCRRINVTSGGQITACDPAASSAAGDTRAC